MSYSDISHLDFTPDPGLGLRERALEAWGLEEEILEEKRKQQTAALLQVAARHLGDVLEVVNATNVRVKPKDNSDGDGTVLCDIDGMEFKVDVLYKSGAEEGDDPNSVNLWVKTGNNWSSVGSLATLGRYLDKGSVTCATD